MIDHITMLTFEIAIGMLDNFLEYFDILHWVFGCFIIWIRIIIKCFDFKTKILFELAEKLGRFLFIFLILQHNILKRIITFVKLKIRILICFFDQSVSNSCSDTRSWCIHNLTFKLRHLNFKSVTSFVNLFMIDHFNWWNYLLNHLLEMFVNTDRILFETYFG